jgi:Protein of unknown function (DUF742)
MSELEGGPLVRPYAMTHGRTRPATDTSFDLISLVMATASAPSAFGLEPEHRAIMDLVRQPLSVAEIAAHIDLPVGVVRVLLDDLRKSGSIVVREPMSVSRLPNKRVLKAVINGIRAL